MKKFFRNRMPRPDKNTERFKEQAKPGAYQGNMLYGISTKNLFGTKAKRSLPLLAAATFVVLVVVISASGCLSEQLGTGHFKNDDLMGLECTYLFNKSQIYHMQCTIPYPTDSIFGNSANTYLKGFEACFKNLSALPPQRIKYKKSQCAIEKNYVKCDAPDISSSATSFADALDFRNGCEKGYAEAKKQYAF